MFVHLPTDLSTPLVCMCLKLLDEEWCLTADHSKVENAQYFQLLILNSGLPWQQNSTQVNTWLISFEVTPRPRSGVCPPWTSQTFTPQIVLPSPRKANSWNKDCVCRSVCVITVVSNKSNVTVGVLLCDCWSTVGTDVQAWGWHELLG